MALNTRIHPVRMPAGRIGIAAMCADGAGLGRKHHKILCLRGDNGRSFACHMLVRRACGERLVNAGNVGHLCHCRHNQRMRICKAPLSAFFYRANRRRTGPGRSVHGALVFADGTHPFGKDQLACVDPGICIQRKLRKLLLCKFFVQHCAHLADIVHTRRGSCQPPGKKLPSLQPMRVGDSFARKRPPISRSCEKVPQISA